MQAYTSPRRFLGDTRILYWCLGVVVAAGIILAGFFYNRHEVRIYADGKEMNLVMRGGTVADAVKKAKIPLGAKDIIEPSLKTPLTDDLQVRITRLFNVTLADNGTTAEHWVPTGTVGDTLAKIGIKLNPGDNVIPALEKKISAGQIIEVIRLSHCYTNQSVKVPFKVERRNDNSMERGLTRTVRQGQDGLIQKTIKITLNNGREVKREVIGQKVVRDPVNKIVAVGTVRTKTVSRGETLRFSRVITMNATAYTYTGHRTASGAHPYKGVVAVDPDLIPLGAKLYIEGYGYATALDIGSSIRNNRIDLFFESVKEARSWGRRSVKVYILQ